MAGLLVLAHENICQISSRGPVFRPQVKGLHEGFFLLLLFPTVPPPLCPTSRPGLDNIPKLFFALVSTRPEESVMFISWTVDLGQPSHCPLYVQYAAYHIPSVTLHFGMNLISRCTETNK